MPPATGFFGHIQRNHARSLIMFLGFLLSMHLAVALIVSIPFPFWSHIPAVFDQPRAYFKAMGVFVTAFSILLFGLFYFGHTFFMKWTLGFEPVDWKVCPRLHTITQNLANTAGIPMPKLDYIADPALNSFACGLSADSAHIVVTQGLLDALDDEELEAVMAHEIAHIKNGDMHMMAVANAAIGSIKFINLLNPMKMTFMKGVMDAVPKFILIPILLFMWPIILVLGMLVVFYSVVMQFVSLLASTTRYFISSSREYIADAEAVRLTHNPAALVSALSKITGRSQVHGVNTMANAMMIDGPATGIQASHPPIRARMDKLIELSGSMVHGTGIRKDTRGQSLAKSNGNAYSGQSTPLFGQPQAAPSSFKAAFQPQPVQTASAHNVRDFIPDSADWSQDTGYRQNQDTPESIFDRINMGNDGEFGVDKMWRWALIGALGVWVCMELQNPDRRQKLYDAFGMNRPVATQTMTASTDAPISGELEIIGLPNTANANPTDANSIPVLRSFSSTQKAENTPD